MTCVWTPDEYTLENSDAWGDLDEEAQDRALMLATSSLIALTYGRVGTCPITIRPCPDEAQCGCWPAYSGFDGGFIPYMGVDGNWYNRTCGHRLACKPLSEIDIPGPVGFISSLKIDGVEQDLDGNDWRLDEGHLLVWQGATASPVPSTQNLNLPDTEAGTWSITYSKSYPVGEDGQLAVAWLAIEFGKAFQPKGKCALPRGVTNVVRNGVTFTVQAGLFPNGLTNIDVVDEFILKWAPAGMPIQTAMVFDPARVSRNRRTNSVPRGGL